MSNEARNYVRRLHLSGRGSTGRGSPHVKFVASEIADRAADDASGIKSWGISTGALADETHISERHIRDYLDILVEHGLVSVLDRFDSRGRQTSSCFVVHGPWDLFGGAGTPFPEVTYSKGRPRLDETRPIEVTNQRWAELEQRFSAMAQDYGTLPSGTPRARWRVGCRAHGITTWWGVGRTVLHSDRVATVIAARDRDGRTPVSPQVCLRYSDDTESFWVAITDLTQRSVENTSSYGGDSFVIPLAGGDDTSDTPGDDTSDTPGDDTSDTPRSSSQHPLHPPQAPSPRSPQEEEGSLPREDGDGAAAAVGVLDRALAAWPGGHRRPVAAERARLVERIAAELSSGAAEEDVVYHLSRDLEPSRVSTTAVQVVMGRTKSPRWGRDPRPASQAPHSAPEAGRAKCGLHAYATVPCGQCRADFQVGDVQALRAELDRRGVQQRPDLAKLLAAPV
ncbi:hypothetical protein EFW17_22455 [Halostreptopolyspora alba]|uniref:Uncharacterized protein n=1 Tax=Halostreptopolyspora alba TaxID=2487137 RepID=A0A3N0DYR1_9ACTN|nr:hypothetical protein EFW17_22455 [Nocardiopsaceae bacterium YIM 96095]